MRVVADFSGAFEKTRILKNTPAAIRRQADRWAAQTVLALKRSAAGMRKSIEMGHLKTGQLARNVDMRVYSSEANYRVILGTGLGSSIKVKYARIQDEGGEIRAKDKFFTIGNMKGKPRLGPFMTVPLRGVMGRMANYGGAFSIRSEKSGKFFVVRPDKSSKAGGLEALFALRRSVKIPPSGWFSNVIHAQEPKLRWMMSPPEVKRVAASIGSRRVK